jgi:hypothetical protein
MSLAGAFLLGTLVAITVSCVEEKEQQSKCCGSTLESDDKAGVGETTSGEARLTVFLPQQKQGATAEATDLDEVTFDRVVIQVKSFNPPCNPVSDVPLVCSDATALESRTIEIVAGKTPEPLKFSGLKSYLNIDFKIYNKNRLLAGGGTGNDLVPGEDTYLGFGYNTPGVLGLFQTLADGKVETDSENSVDDICQDSMDSAYYTKSGEPAFLCKLEIDGKLVKSERAPSVSLAKQAVKVSYCYDVKTPMKHAVYETALTCKEDGTF